MRKVFNSIFYTVGKFGKGYREVLNTDSPYLFARGRYPTKITAEDLPEDYIEVRSRVIRYTTGYFKTSGIVDMKYQRSNLNHLFKDDYLYVSYSEPLKCEKNRFGFNDVVNYDICLCGNCIIPFILAAEKYSGIDTTNIRKQIEEKRKWFKENYREDYIRMFGDRDVDLFQVFST